MPSTASRPAATPRSRRRSTSRSICSSRTGTDRARESEAASFGERAGSVPLARCFVEAARWRARRDTPVIGLPARPPTVPTIRNEVLDQQTDTTAPTATAAVAEAPAPEVDAPEVVEEEVEEETASHHRRRSRGHVPRRRDRRHDRRLRRRRHRHRRSRQDRLGRSAPRHRLQVRGRHPLEGAVDPQRRRPPRGRLARRSASKPSSSPRRTRTAG